MGLLQAFFIIFRLIRIHEHVIHDELEHIFAIFIGTDFLSKSQIRIQTQ